jgi:hypothetical protein
LNPLKLQELVTLWKSQVYDKGEEIDPTNEQDWYSLAIGWALGKDLTPDEAHAFANHITFTARLL